MSYRVIQWATGATGTYALRSVIQHPDMELVGLYVYSRQKIGVDAGELCRLEPIGVKATNDIEPIMDMDADAVLYMPLPSARINEDPDFDVKMICRLLESGKNVITTVGFLYPKAYGPEIVKRFESACIAGNASFHGTGANPGFLSDLLPLTLSSISARIDRVYVLESSVFDFYPSPTVVLEMMQFGADPKDFKGLNGTYGSWLSGLFIESIHMIADGLMVRLDEIKSSVDFERAEQSVDIAAGAIEAGTIVAQQWRWEGIVEGISFITLEVIYRAIRDCASNWPKPNFKVHVEGRPNILIDLGEEWLSNALLATASHAVNAIPYVCEAAPGIRTFLDLPVMIGRKVARPKKS
jgi:hypothetical protein